MTARRAAGVGVRGRPGLAGLPGRRRVVQPDGLAAAVAGRLALRLLVLLAGMLVCRLGVAALVVGLGLRGARDVVGTALACRRLAALRRLRLLALAPLGGLVRERD